MKRIDANGLRDFLNRHSVAYREKSVTAGTELDLDQCPFNAAHVSGDARLLIFSNGQIAFKCHHNSCKGKTLPDFLKHYEPDFYNDGSFSRDDPAKTADPAAALAALRTVNDVQEEDVEWLIPFFLPKGAITSMGGDGGVGKTMTWCAIAAAISTGRECFLDQVAAESDFVPAGKRSPGKVLFFSSEDSVSKVLRKRLRGLDADLSRIKFLEPSSEIFPRIKFDSPELRAIVEAEKPALVIFDPLQSFIPEKTDMSRRNAMRAALNPLIALAEENNCAVLIAMHSNKRRGGAAGRNRLSDSSDIWDISRSVWLLGRDRSAEAPTFYLSQEKGNYGMSRLSALYNTDGGTLNYLGTSSKHDADFVLANDRTRAGGSPIQTDCKDAILEILEGIVIDAAPPMEIKDLDSELMDARGFTKSAVRKAKADLKKANQIRLWCTGQGATKKWFIGLPEPALEI